MILIKKAIRAMLRNKKSYISCILLMAFGISFYIGYSQVINELELSRDDYYKNNRIADVFIDVMSISKSDADKLYNIDGVNEVSPRIVKDFRIELPNNDSIITVRLLSSDTENNETKINQYIVNGQDIRNENDILLNIEFMKLNGLNNGDVVTIINSGRETEFTIVGSVMSPEYVYLMKNAKEMVPDKQSFGFGYVSADTMASLANTSSFNNIVVDLEKGYEFEDIKSDFEDSLNGFGIITMVGKEDNLSYAMLETELTGIRSTSTTIPFMFLLMVMVILYLTLSRVIEQERMEIGMLKAFGYSNGKILRHYLVYGVIVGIFGGIFGCLIGLGMANSLLTMYLEYFLMPITETSSFVPYITGFVLAIMCGLIGTYFGVRKVLKLSPVEAMKPPAPKIDIKKVRNNIILKKVFKTYGFMAIRNIERNKLRSAFIILGVAFSFAMGAFMASASSMVDGMMFVQLDKVKKYDAKITFDKVVNKSTLEYFGDYGGVDIAEGLLEIPLMLRNGDESEGAILVGLGEENSLYKIYDEDIKGYKNVSKDGIVLCSYYANKLDAWKGDYIYIDSPMLDESVKIMVTDVAQMTMADAVYMDIESMYRLFGTDGYSSIVLKMEDTNILKEDFKNASNIISIEDKQRTYNNLKAMMSSYEIMYTMMDIITIIIVFLIIYNISTISFAERSREYATLKIIGVSTKEIAEIVDLEFWILTGFGIFIGIFFAIGLKYSIGTMLEMENFTLDTTLHYSEVLRASVECIVAVFLSNLMNRKNVKKLNLVSVLKERV